MAERHQEQSSAEMDARAHPTCNEGQLVPNMGFFSRLGRQQQVWMGL